MKRRAPGYRFRPVVELLEDRELPTVSHWGPVLHLPTKGTTAAPAKVTAPAAKAVTPAPKVTTAPKKSAGSPLKLTIKPFSDVPSTPALSARPGNDITDTYLFPSPTNPNNVVVIMDVHPLIPPGSGGQVEFDPNVLYEMKFSTQDNGMEDTTIQFKFTGNDVATEQVQVSGPVAPEPGRAGTSSFFEQPDPVTGTINQTFTTSNGLRVFAGVAEDPFFIDLNQLFTLLPDRAFPLGPTFTNTHGQSVSTTPADPNQLMDNSWRSPQQARDFFKRFNVLTIAVELPRSMLGGGTIQYWATTDDDAGMSVQDPAYGHHNTHPGVCQQIFTQVARVGKPLVNELFATVANNQHQINDTNSPADDEFVLKNEVLQFMTHAAGRSQATAAAAAALLTPSALVADLSQGGPAGYLGVETHGAIGSLFGGRALTDNVVDTTLGIAFGNTLAALGLAPDDGAETPALTSNNVTQNTAPKHYQSTFPFLGPPQ